MLADTAGMRDSDDVIEQEGVRRSHQYRESADLVLEIRDASSPTQNAALPTAVSAGKQLLLHVINKVDLVGASDRDRLRGAFPQAVQVSARTGDGIEELDRRIFELLVAERWSDGGPTITRQRQYEGLNRCHRALGRARMFVQDNAPLEIVSIELRSACEALEELTGKVYDEEILNRIFGEFCIGK